MMVDYQSCWSFCQIDLRQISEPVVASSRQTPYTMNTQGVPKKMQRVESSATVKDCPKLNKLMPAWSHFPLMAMASAKPKQSAKPTMKAASCSSHYSCSSNPCHITTTLPTKSRLLARLKRTICCILWANSASSSPPTNSPQPSTMKVVKVSLLSCSSSISLQQRQKQIESSLQTQLIITPEKANVKNSNFGIFLLCPDNDSSCSLSLLSLMDRGSLGTSGRGPCSLGNYRISRQRREMRMLSESITKEQTFCPSGSMSAAERALPMMLEHCTMQMLSPKQLLVLSSRLPHQLTKLLSPLQQLESMSPQMRLPARMTTTTRLEKPTKRKTTEKLRKMFQPIAPKKMIDRYFHLPMYPLQSAPSPDPRKTRAMLSGPTQLLPFWEANWLMMPRLALLMAAKSIATLEMKTTRLTYVILVLINYQSATSISDIVLVSKITAGSPQPRSACGT